MANQELDVEKYISLLTEQELSKRERAMWQDIALDYGPVNVVDSVQIYTEEGRKNIKLLYRKAKEGFEYTIPLSRNLLAEEAEKIVEAWDAYYDGDFEIETSSTEYERNKEVDFEFDNNNEDLDETSDYFEFAEQLSKLNHQNYMKRLESSGWRYGVKYSEKEKTTPVMMPWEQLPDKYRVIDTDYAIQVLELIENLGYDIQQE